MQRVSRVKSSLLDCCSVGMFGLINSSTSERNLTAWKTLNPDWFTQNGTFILNIQTRDVMNGRLRHCPPSGKYRYLFLNKRVDCLAGCLFMHAQAVTYRVRKTECYSLKS